MKNIKEESKLLASLAVFRELYDEQNDIYGVISQFLNEIITSNALYKFDVTGITNRLNTTFDFSIPEAVVSAALRRLDLQKEHGFYFVKKTPQIDKGRVNALQLLKVQNNNALIESLFIFIEEEQNSTLSDQEKIKIVRSLYSFLLDDSNGTEYSEYISGFVIKNKKEENFKETLKNIREGVILYTGIKYSNLGEIGSWRTSLTIYLDTEILFHFAGYNGNLFKSLFIDFFGYVNEINGRARKPLIKLEFFGEVKSEIDEFFSKAERIVEGKERLYPNRTAMASIVEGCKSPSDVLAKKTDLYSMLNSNGIFESEAINYIAESNHKYNIIDEKTINSLSVELKFDITEHLKFLNFVGIKRANADANNFENIGWILLTGNSNTIKVALHEKIKPEGAVPLSTTLNWITNRFWFKLNKGFGNENSPISFDVITKAQIILSTNLNKSIGDKYDDLQTQFKEGKITEEQAKARIVDLRSQAKKPEEIDGEDISSILDVLAEDSLDRFIEKQEIDRNEALKQSEENIKLKRELGIKEKALVSEESARKEAQEALIRTLEINLNDKKKIVKTLESQKGPIDEIAIQKFKTFKISIGIALLLLYAIPLYILWLFGWDIFDHWITLIGSFLFSPVPLLLYLLIFDKEWVWNPKQFLERKREQYIRQKYQQFQFDINQLNTLKDQVHKIEIEIGEQTNGNISHKQNAT